MGNRYVSQCQFKGRRIPFDARIENGDQVIDIVFPREGFRRDQNQVIECQPASHLNDDPVEIVRDRRIEIGFNDNYRRIGGILTSDRDIIRTGE